MKDFEKQIQDLIINKMDIAGAAKDASDKILNDPDFFKRLEESLLRDDYSRISLFGSIFSRCTDILAQRFCEKNASKILENIKPEAISNAVMFGAIKNTRNSL